MDTTIIRNTAGAVIHKSPLPLRLALERCARDGISLTGAKLTYADLARANLSYAYLAGANLTRAKGLPQLHPDPRALRLAVADHIEAHPELHDQNEWGAGDDDPSCQTPCCVAGWACHLGGGTHGYTVPTAATLLLHVDGLPMPDFRPSATREGILNALRSEGLGGGMDQTKGLEQ